MALLPWYEDLPNKFEVVFLPPGAETNEMQQSAFLVALTQNGITHSVLYVRD
jgi:hypothetical protein